MRYYISTPTLHLQNFLKAQSPLFSYTSVQEYFYAPFGRLLYINYKPYIIKIKQLKLVSQPCSKEKGQPLFRSCPYPVLTYSASTGDFLRKIIIPAPPAIIRAIIIKNIAIPVLGVTSASGEPMITV